MTDCAMEFLVVSSSLLVIKPNSYFCFTMASSLSTAILSALSLYSVFWSSTLVFLVFLDTALISGFYTLCNRQSYFCSCRFFCWDAFRIMTHSLEIPLSGCDENISFVIGIKTHLFYPDHPLFICILITFSIQYKKIQCIVRTDHLIDFTENLIYQVLT